MLSRSQLGLGQVNPKNQKKEEEGEEKEEEEEKEGEGEEEEGGGSQLQACKKKGNDRRVKLGVLNCLIALGTYDGRNSEGKKRAM